MTLAVALFAAAVGLIPQSASSDVRVAGDGRLRKPVPQEKKAAMPKFGNLGPGVRYVLTTRDFETDRADGKFDRSVGFAMDYLRRMKPAYSFDNVETAEEMPAWRAKVRAKLKELLQVGDDMKRDFRLLSSEDRDGYRLSRYEFYPEEALAVPILVLEPSCALQTGAKVPAVVCLPGSGASLDSLAGEPDDSANRFPLRNRQAWWYVKMGMVAVALENPATARNGERGVSHFVTQAQFARIMSIAGRSGWGFMVEHVLQAVEFLKAHPLVDQRRIGVSALSLGCIPALYSAVLSDDISALVYNDFVTSWAIRAMAQTEGDGQCGVGRKIDARRPFGFYRWFDDEPDLMAAIAPRPMILSEGGPWKRHIEKVKRAYALAGASDKLRVAYYARFAEPSARKFEDVDLATVTGLDADGYLLRANVDAKEHSFHPDVNLPWLAETFFGKAELPEGLMQQVKQAATERPLW